MPKFRRTRAAAVALALAILVATVSVDYTVKRGDTLGQIASEKGVELSDLIDANDISNPDLIFPGQILIIPGKDGKPSVIHVVIRGDTLNRIAMNYGVSSAKLASANSLANPDLIFPGQEIVIKPGKSSGGGGDGGGGDGGSDGRESELQKGSRSGRSHIVQRGETLGSIAAQYSGVSVADIERANGILDGRIYSGTRLFLDGPSFTASGTKGGSSTYRVQPGDRLGDIAARFDTTISAIASLNGITDVNNIRSGQLLEIPGGGTSWVCPIADASFFNDWGFPRTTERYHEGNDIFAAFRAPVRAPVSGKVTFVVGSIGGNQFNLIGDDGVRYLGSHMDAFEGKNNRRVKAGEVIGYVGNTGNAAATRPHLHFGIYLGKLAVNPYPSLIANGCK
jgi:LysM repeat protein